MVRLELVAMADPADTLQIFAAAWITCIQSPDVCACSGCQVLSARLLGDNHFAEAHAPLIEIGGTPRLPFLSRPYPAPDRESPLAVLVKSAAELAGRAS